MRAPRKQRRRAPNTAFWVGQKTATIPGKRTVVPAKSPFVSLNSWTTEYHLQDLDMEGYPHYMV